MKNPSNSRPLKLSRSFSCSDVGRVYDFPVRNGGSFSSDEDEDAEEIDGRRDENDTPLGRAMSSDGDGQDKEHDFMDPLDEILHREESARQDELIDPETPVIPALQIDTEMDRTVVSVLLKKPVVCCPVCIVNTRLILSMNTASRLYQSPSLSNSALRHLLASHLTSQKTMEPTTLMSLMMKMGSLKA